jgi:hypothetical protein
MLETCFASFSSIYLTTFFIAFDHSAFVSPQNVSLTSTFKDISTYNLIKIHTFTSYIHVDD